MTTLLLVFLAFLAVVTALVGLILAVENRAIERAGESFDYPRLDERDDPNP